MSDKYGHSENVISDSQKEHDKRAKVEADRVKAAEAERAKENLDEALEVKEEPQTEVKPKAKKGKTK